MTVPLGPLSLSFLGWWQGPAQGIPENNLIGPLGPLARTQRNNFALRSGGEDSPPGARQHFIGKRTF